MADAGSGALDEREDFRVADVFGDFVGRLRPYDPIAIAPSGQLTRLALAGSGMSACAAVLLALLPAPGFAREPFWRSGRVFVNDLAGVAEFFVLPVLVFALVSAVCDAVIYFRRIPSLVAVYFVVAQPWIGVLLGFLAALMVATLLGLLLLNFMLWLLQILVYIIIGLFALSLLGSRLVGGG